MDEGSNVSLRKIVQGVAAHCLKTTAKSDKLGLQNPDTNI